LLRQLLPDWSGRLALQVGLPLEAVQVLLEAAVVAAQAANSSQVIAVPAQLAAALRQRDSWVPEHPDSYHRLPAALVPEAELVRAKLTRTQVNRDRW